MRMTPKERILAVINGEEPDKTPVFVYTNMLDQYPGGWYRRLKKRGLGLFMYSDFYRTHWAVVMSEQNNPYLTDVKYSKIEYFEKGLKKRRLIYETPVGNISSVWMTNPIEDVSFIESPEEFLVKQPSDWRVINYILRGIVENLTPNYRKLLIADDEIGVDGLVIGLIVHTAWQRAWIELASPERAVIDFSMQSEEIHEYIELHERLHTRIAEFAAECPVKFLDVSDNITDMVSPKYFNNYCKPIYEIYKKQLQGSGKVLGVHMDGRLGRLKNVIAETPIDVIESFSVPPIGDVSLSEAKSIWPNKMIFMNTASSLAWAEPKQVREFYERLAAEWGSKRGLILELSEQLPPDKVESHMSAALDAFGY